MNLGNLFHGWHLIIVVAVLVIVFGWKRLPDIARSLGRSARVLKSEVSELKGDKDSDGHKDETKGSGSDASRSTVVGSVTSAFKEGAGVDDERREGRRDERPYDRDRRDDHGYRDGRSYRDDRRDGRPYGRDDRDYRDERPYDRDDRGYGEERGYGRDRRDDHGYRDDRGYHDDRRREERPYGEDDRRYRDERGYEDDEHARRRRYDSGYDDAGA